MALVGGVVHRIGDILADLFKAVAELFGVAFLRLVNEVNAGDDEGDDADRRQDVFGLHEFYPRFERVTRSRPLGSTVRKIEARTGVRLPRGQARAGLLHRPRRASGRPEAQALP